MNSSCVLLFQQFRKGLGKGDHIALEYKQTAGTHSWDKRHLFSWTAGLFKFNLHSYQFAEKKLWFSEKTWRLNGTILSYLDFELQILDLWERKDNCPRQNGSCQRCFKSNLWHFSPICDLVWSVKHLRDAFHSSCLWFIQFSQLSF